MKRFVPIQFMAHDTETVRLEKLRRVAEYLGSLAEESAVTTVSASGGSTWYAGSGAPAASLGEAGDFYLDVDTGDVYELEG